MSLNSVLLRGFNTQLCEYVDDAMLACGKNQNMFQKEAANSDSESCVWLWLS